MASKIYSAAEAVERIPDGATVAVGGTGPVLEPDMVLEALQSRFIEQQKPRNLTLFSPILPGDRPGIGGLSCFAHEGLLAKVIGASFSTYRCPRLLDLVRDEKIEGYTMGIGPMMGMLSSAAGGRPGIFTTVGIGTFLDPRVEGGCMNKRSTNPPVRVEMLDGKEYLYHPAIPIDVAIIRGTTADENGYISFEEEPNTLGMLELAGAAKASGGIVIVQVKRVARANSLNPQLVRIPGVLVDMIVVNPKQTQVSPAMADPLEGWNPFLAGALKAPLSNVPVVKDILRRTILRRAALELRHGDIINLGAGMATGLAGIAVEEKIYEDMVFTNEHGVFGGVMASAYGKSFVPAYNADAIMDSEFMFRFYERGGLDITFLGVGEADAAGNINVSKFGKEWMAPGGFNSITDKTRRIVFCTSLTAGGLEVGMENGALKIISEGRHKKFIPKVSQITLNGPRAFSQGQEVTYITERAVFKLGAEGPELIEIAPGMNLERDVLPNIGFNAKVSPSLRVMDQRIFLDAPMGLKAAFS